MKFPGQVENIRSARLRGGYSRSMHRALSLGLILAMPAVVAYGPMDYALRGWSLSASNRGKKSRSAMTFSSPAPKAVDELIVEMRSTSTQQLPRLVAENIKMIDATFFLRLAELSDATEDRLEKARLSELADTVARTLQSALEKTDEVADSKSQQAQELLAILADEDTGDFFTPVPPEKLDVLRQRVRETLPTLDETFVATLRSFLNKCVDDGMDGMVGIIQKVLQVFASEVLITMTASGVREELRRPLHEFFSTDPDRWGEVLREGQMQEVLPADELSQLLKEEVAQAVLELPSGSLTQSVAAEYLGEAIKLLDTAEAQRS